MKYWLLYDGKIKYAVREHSWIARMAAGKLHANTMAIVIGKTVHLWNASKDDFLKDNKWVSHELAHIRQFRKYGFFRFIILYLIESIKHGYYQNRFEVEARAAELSAS